MESISEESRYFAFLSHPVRHHCWLFLAIFLPSLVAILTKFSDDAMVLRIALFWNILSSGYIMRSRRSGTVGGTLQVRSKTKF